MLAVSDGRNEQRIPLKPQKADDFIFCQTRKMFNHVEVMHQDRLPLSTLSPWLRIIGEITGFSQVVSGYALRYAGGKALDGSGE
jgi:hypothetical protein